MYKITNGKLVNSLVEFIGGKKDVVSIFQNSTIKGQSQNNLFPFCPESILSAAWSIKWDHPLCLNQFNSQKAIYLNFVFSCIFTYDLC